MPELPEYIKDLIGETLMQVTDKLNLGNSIPNRDSLESEEFMSNTIRRHVRINGTTVWITAKTEQEYMEKVVRLSGGNVMPVSKPKHPFGEYALTWLNVFSRPNVERVTSVSYEQQLKNYILPVLGEMNLEDITPADVQKIFNNMGKRMKQESKNKVKIVLNQIFKMAMNDDIIAKNPLEAPSIRIKGEKSTPTVPYSVNEMRYMAEHLIDIQSGMDRAWLAISISLPLRPEEVLGLTWADVDEVNGVFHIRNTVTHPARNEPEFKTYTKTAASIRDLAVSEELLSCLPVRGKPNEFVIGGKTPLTYMQVRRMRERIQRDIQFDGSITPRRFRTTVATDISAQTHDLKLVQKMLGHSSPQMTLKHYDKGRSTTVDATDAIASCYGLKRM
jgi:integrase